MFRLPDPAAFVPHLPEIFAICLDYNFIIFFSPAELGDYDPLEHDSDYLQEFKFCPKQVSYELLYVLKDFYRKI